MLPLPIAKPQRSQEHNYPQADQGDLTLPFHRHIPGTFGEMNK
jgi:hypothetical protein